MKKYIILLSLTAFVFAGEKTTYFKVKGMACQYSCPTQVKSALINVEGVKMCDVNFKTSTVTVTYNEEELLGQDILKILSEKTDFEISIETEEEEEKSTIKDFFSKFFKS